MNKQEAESRIKELKQLVNYHRHLYYIEDRQELSDQEYDSLEKELKTLEEKFPEFLTEDSPTQRPGGAPLGKFNSVEHSTPMLSLGNTYSQEELLGFHDRTIRFLEKESDVTDFNFGYSVEPKIDGLAISVIYRNGYLEQAITRGDGRKGDDVTENVRTISDIPHRLKDEKLTGRLEVRGEIYFKRSNFEKANADRIASGQESFANPRNAASGTMKLLDQKEVAKRGLSAFLYQVIEPEQFELKTQTEVLAFLKNLGFATPELASFCKDINKGLETALSFETKRDDLDYEIDGAVFKVDDLALWEALGATGKEPRFMISYKFQAEQATTKLKSITLQVGKTGAITPVAELEPVQLAGTVVRRATLHNFELLEKLDIREGDLVVVQKAGEIIPQILSSVVEKRDGTEKVFKMPSVCPACGGNLVKESGQAVLRCTNENCTPQIVARIRHFASRDAMDIGDLGGSKVEQLVEKELIKDFPDLYRLEFDQVEALERMGKKSTTNLLKGIEESKSRELHRLIYGIGILNIGITSARILSDEFGSLKAITEANEEQLTAIEDIGPIVAESIMDFFESERGKYLMEQFAELGLNTKLKEKNESTTSGSALKGKSVVVTGTLPTLKRKEAEEMVRSAGGKPSSSVSAKTDFLLAGEKAGSKLTKAEKLGVKILSENEFLEILNRENPADN